MECVPATHLEKHQLLRTRPEVQKKTRSAVHCLFWKGLWISSLENWKARGLLPRVWAFQSNKDAKDTKSLGHHCHVSTLIPLEGKGRCQRSSDLWLFNVWPSFCWSCHSSSPKDNSWGEMHRERSLGKGLTLLPPSPLPWELCMLLLFHSR